MTNVEQVVRFYRAAIEGDATRCRTSTSFTGRSFDVLVEFGKSTGKIILVTAFGATAEEAAGKLLATLKGRGLVTDVFDEEHPLVVAELARRDAEGPRSA